MTSPELWQNSPGTRPRSWEAVAKDQLVYRCFRPQQHCEPSLFPAWDGPWLTFEQLLNKSCSSQTFGGKNWWVFLCWLWAKRKKFPPVINSPDRLLLNMAVLVGMFLDRSNIIHRRCEMILCVYGMLCHDQSDPPLIAPGARSSVTKPWYLVLQGCYLIKTNLMVLISTGFVWGGSRIALFLCLN